MAEQKTCNEAADAFMKWGQYYFEHGRSIDAAVCSACAETLKHFGDAPAPEALLAEYGRLFDPRVIG